MSALVEVRHAVALYFQPVMALCRGLVPVRESQSTALRRQMRRLSDRLSFNFAVASSLVAAAASLCAVVAVVQLARTRRAIQTNGANYAIEVTRDAAVGSQLLGQISTNPKVLASMMNRRETDVRTMLALAHLELVPVVRPAVNDARWASYSPVSIEASGRFVASVQSPLCRPGEECQVTFLLVPVGSVRPGVESAVLPKAISASQIFGIRVGE